MDLLSHHFSASMTRAIDLASAAHTDPIDFCNAHHIAPVDGSTLVFAGTTGHADVRIVLAGSSTRVSVTHGEATVTSDMLSDGSFTLVADEPGRCHIDVTDAGSMS